MRPGVTALILVPVLAIVVVSVLVSSDGSASAQSLVTVTMGPTIGPDGGGEQSGTATLTAMGSQTEVVISIDTSPNGAIVEQPAHVHAGACGAGSLADVAYPLTNVVDGASTTVIDATLESLQSGGFAINVHRDGEQIGAYVSCGEIPTSSAEVPSTGGNPATSRESLSLVYVLTAAGALAVIGGATMGLLARRAR
ncbi:MAG: CHRD domain-containing protein [Chloroflexi bacterium]|nr:CHRD domain-containing protein [Chloroflexota bacterium]